MSEGHWTDGARKVRQDSGNLSVYRIDAGLSVDFDTVEKVRRYGTLVATRFENRSALDGSVKPEWWNQYLLPNERSRNWEVRAYEAMPLWDGPS